MAYSRMREILKNFRNLLATNVFNKDDTKLWPVGVDGEPGQITIPVGTPENIANANAIGVNDGLFVRRDHRHNHPAALGFALHHPHGGRWIEIGGYMVNLIGVGQVVFDVAGRVHLTPFGIHWPCIIDGIMYGVGNVAAGNVRVGIYGPCDVVVGALPDIPDGHDLVTESASAAQPGANIIHYLALTPIAITEPGLYFVGIQGDDAAGTYVRVFDVNTEFNRTFDQVYGAFTDPCPATVARNQLPMFALRVRSVP